MHSGAVIMKVVRDVTVQERLLPLCVSALTVKTSSRGEMGQPETWDFVVTSGDRTGLAIHTKRNPAQN